MLLHCMEYGKTLGNGFYRSRIEGEKEKRASGAGYPLEDILVGFGVSTKLRPKVS